MRFRQRSYLIANYAVDHALTQTSLASFFSLPRPSFFLPSSVPWSLSSLLLPFSLISFCLSRFWFSSSRNAPRRAHGALRVFFDASGGVDYDGLIIDDDKNSMRKMFRGGKQRKHEGNVRLRYSDAMISLARDPPEQLSPRSLSFFTNRKMKIDVGHSLLISSRFSEINVKLPNFLIRISVIALSSSIFHEFHLHVNKKFQKLQYFGIKFKVSSAFPSPLKDLEYRYIFQVDI